MWRYRLKWVPVLAQDQLFTSERIKFCPGWNLEVVLGGFIWSSPANQKTLGEKQKFPPSHVIKEEVGRKWLCSSVVECVSSMCEAGPNLGSKPGKKGGLFPVQKEPLAPEYSSNLVHRDVVRALWVNVNWTCGSPCTWGFPTPGEIKKKQKTSCVEGDIKCDSCVDVFAHPTFPSSVTPADSASHSGHSPRCPRRHAKDTHEGGLFAYGDE